MGFLATVLATMLYGALGYGGLLLFGSGDRFEFPGAVLHLVFVLVCVIHLLQIDSPAISSIRAALTLLWVPPAGAIVTGLFFYVYAWIKVWEGRLADGSTLLRSSIQLGLVVGSVLLGAALICLFRVTFMSLLRPSKRGATNRLHRSK